MNITTTARNFNTSPALNAFVRKQIKDSLSHVESEVVAVDVFMADINGPKGGVDKQALIKIHMRSRRVIAIESQHENLYAAFRNAIRRGKRAVRRHLRKSRRIENTRIAELIRPADGRIGAS